MVWYPCHKPKLKENFTGVMYTFIQSAIMVFHAKTHGVPYQSIETIKMAFHKTASRYVRSMTTTHYRLNPALISLNPFVLWIEISPNKGIDLTLECVTRTQIGTQSNCFLMQYILQIQTSEESASLGALIETHSRLILRTLSYVTVNSQDGWMREFNVTFA